ncbi:MAG TPA: flagellar basal body rod protein FlgB [Clostridiales bacterium UBA8960]|jgi:flagellar basal-body rod protein FlgB|nr:flagellar basal body rod protein FlgB [Clostridiales bacterium UBA8960]
MLKNSFKNIDFMSKALSGSWMKNSAIANNIANVNTPGYKRQTVNFQDVLQNEMNLQQSVKMTKTNDKHLDPMNTGQITVETIGSTSYRVDDNNVDIDVENAEMAKNTIYYNTVVNQVNQQYKRLQAALRINR